MSASYLQGGTESPRDRSPLEHVDLTPPLMVNAEPQARAPNPFSMTSLPTTPLSNQPIPFAKVEATGTGPASLSRSSPLPKESERLDTGTQFSSDDTPSLDGEPHLKPFASMIRYAELVASLRVNPERAGETLKDGGLTTGEDRNKVHGYWLGLFESDPIAKKRFDQLCDAMVRKLRGAP